MATPNKDTIYIDIDDEITGIIDKVRSSDAKIVALVLPKRAAVLQSIVNMKLLKRAGDDVKKHLVLITTESSLMPLAGAAGVLVAKTLTSKPEVPVAPAADDGSEETVDEDEEVTASSAGDRPIGELAGMGAAGAGAGAAADDDGVETVELDDDEDADVDEPVKSKDFIPPKAKKDKKLAVPNFERFRLLLALGGLLLVALIVFLYFAISVWPKAAIAITTDATNYNVNLNLTADTKATKVNETDHILPAKQVQQQKTYTQQVPATGQKNNGEKASGTLSMTAKVCNSISEPADVPAGTGVSSGGLTFITQESTSFEVDSVKSGCINFKASDSTSILAQNGGSQYNTNGGNFAVAGRTDISASSDKGTSGGTDNIVKVVSQSDIDAAKAKISANDGSMKQTLKNQLTQQGMFAIGATYNAGTPSTTSTAQPGDAGDNVSVTETITYSMLGVKEDDLKTLVDNEVEDQIDTSKQKILSEGLDTATFNVSNASDTSQQLTMSTEATAGPELNTDELAKQAAGKKPGDVKQLLKGNPGVTDVNVKLSPFWVSSVPKKTDKITVTIAKPKAATNTTNANKP